MSQFMLSTEDNPFNPFVDWDSWLAFDKDSGYNTCAYLARVTITSPDLTEEEQDQAVVDAIMEIMSLNVTGNYVIVSPPALAESTTIKRFVKHNT